MKSFLKRLSTPLLLISGIGLVIGLAALKDSGQNTRGMILEKWQRDYEESHVNVGPSFPCPMTEIEVDGRRCFVAESPVTNAEFFRFTQASSYRSWRERRGHKLTWRHPSADNDKPSHDVAPNAPALWLTPSDGIAYCRWLAKERGVFSPYEEAGELWTTPGPRLPTVSELEAIDSAACWEWTCQTLYDFDASVSRHRDYRSAWKKGGALRHRRDEDLGRDDIEATTFRIAWTALPRDS